MNTFENIIVQLSSLVFSNYSSKMNTKLGITVFVILINKMNVSS